MAGIQETRSLRYVAQVLKAVRNARARVCETPPRPTKYLRVVELAYTTDLKSVAARIEGSIPSTQTICASDEIGRHGGLKSRRQRWRVGSNPTLRTKFIQR